MAATFSVVLPLELCELRRTAAAGPRSAFSRCCAVLLDQVGQPLVERGQRFVEFLVLLLVVEKQPLALREGLLLFLRQRGLLLHAHPLQLEQLAERLLRTGGAVAEQLLATLEIGDLAVDVGDLVVESPFGGAQLRVEPLGLEVGPDRDPASGRCRAERSPAANR